MLRMFLMAVLALAAAPAAAQSGVGCGRQCLLQFLTDYTEALTDNDLSRLAISRDVKATANGIATPPGKGEVWGQAKRIAYRQAFVDPRTGAAVCEGFTRFRIDGDWAKMSVVLAKAYGA